MTCTKDFEITIDAATTCPNWSTLLWDSQALFNATFTPQSGTGNSFNAATLGGVGVVQNQADIDYNGTGCDCQCDMVLGGDSLPNDSTCKFVVYKMPGFVQLVCFAAFGAAPNSYNVPFSLPDTLGATITFRVRVYWQSLPGSAITNLGGVISNV